MKIIPYALNILFFLIIVSVSASAQEKTVLEPSMPIGRFIPVIQRVQAGDGHMPTVWGRQNSYLLETKNGILIFDALRTLDEAEAVNAMVKDLGKPVLAIFLTHPHPDHYGGLSVILKDRPNTAFITTKPVAKELIKNFADRNAGLIKLFGNQWPAKLAVPTKLLNSAESIDFDGVKVTAFDAGSGPGESAADTYWLVEGYNFKAAFIGDLVQYHTPSPGQTAHVSEWICTLQELKQILAGYSKIYPGHGEFGGIELIDWQLNYLYYYWQTVAAILNGRTSLSDQDKKLLRKRMMDYLPDDKGNYYILFYIDNFAKDVVEKGPVPIPCNVN